MMSTTRTTFSLDDKVLRAARIAAARAGKRDSEVVEDALRSYLGMDVVDRIQARGDLTDAQAETLVYDELHASRRP
jgi:metal-responsive CopG/Arc/MetJ family transcriptional regulator